MRSKLLTGGVALCLALGLAVPASAADRIPGTQLAQLCTIDAVPATGGGFGGKLRRREKPPDYLLPKKEEEKTQEQSAPATTTPTVTAPVDTTRKLSELKEIFDKGLISEGEYDTSQTRILADITPQKTGVETGLRMLRQLWDQSLITPSPYAAKRKEMLDAM